MSILPEIIIQKVLVEGIRQLRDDEDKVRQIFRNSPQHFVDSFFELISSTTIDITLSYPREDSQFPCIAIILRGEQESELFVGDILGAGYDNQSGLNTIEGFFFTPDESSATPPTGRLDGETIGEPARIFDAANPVYKEQRGSGLRSSYLMQVMTDNQDFTVFLYSAMKIIILSNLMVLERNGILDVSLTGNDFLPQPSQQPNFIFMRGLTMSFLNFCDYIVVPDEEARRGDPFEPLIAKGFVIDIELAPELASGAPNTLFAFDELLADGTVIKHGSVMIPAGAKAFSILSSTQSPHVREIGAGTISLEGIPPKEKVSIIPFDGVTGSSYTDVYVRGINLKIGATISITKFIEPEKIMGFDPKNIKTLSVTDTNIIHEIQNIKFQSGFSGQSNSTSLQFRASVSESFPLDLTEGMFLQVTGPKTHGAYKETRRVISANVAAKSITVANSFSSSLYGAKVRVIEREDVLKFGVTIPTGTEYIGEYNVKVINTDQLFSTLVRGFEVAS